jgi:hypothetical protein
MIMAKVVKSSAPAFAKGGGGKMFGKQAAGPQKSGTTAATKTGNGGKWGKGGGGHMFGKQSANTRVPGKTGK